MNQIVGLSNTRHLLELKLSSHSDWLFAGFGKIFKRPISPDRYGCPLRAWSSPAVSRWVWSQPIRLTRAARRESHGDGPATVAVFRPLGRRLGATIVGVVRDVGPSPGSHL